MRILPPARRILSPEQRKRDQCHFHVPATGRLLLAVLVAAALTLASCGRSQPAPAPPGNRPEPQTPPATGAQPEPSVPSGTAQSAAPGHTTSPAPEPARTPAHARPKAAGYRAGIWLESRWLESGTSDQAVAKLIRELSGRGITDLYVRTGSFRADGSLSLPDARRVGFMQGEASARGMRLWAWLPGLRHRIDLSTTATVKAAAAAAARLAATGFDGVQLDLEPTPDDDSGYLALLEAIRSAFPKGKRLGAATHLIRPHPAAAEWSPDFYARVARRVDQVAVMAYDTYAATPEEFRAIVAYQTEVALERSPEATEILIGVPTYEDRTERHTPEKEPPWAGFAGVADGFGRADLSDRVTGWALYAHFTTNETEWRLFRERPR